jgi:hypothetical protein
VGVEHQRVSAVPWTFDFHTYTPSLDRDLTGHATAHGANRE